MFTVGRIRTSVINHMYMMTIIRELNNTWSKSWSAATIRATRQVMKLPLKLSGQSDLQASDLSFPSHLQERVDRGFDGRNFALPHRFVIAIRTAYCTKGFKQDVPNFLAQFCTGSCEMYRVTQLALLFIYKVHFATASVTFWNDTGVRIDSISTGNRV
jgi:hypothetical protein